MCAVTERAKMQIEGVRRQMDEMRVNFIKAAQIKKDEGENPEPFYLAEEALARADNDLWLAEVALI